MTRDSLTFEPLNCVRETVGLGIEVRVIDLQNVAAEDDFGAVADARHDRLDLVR
jgi:hypothetical protein